MVAAFEHVSSSPDIPDETIVQQILPFSSLELGFHFKLWLDKTRDNILRVPLACIKWTTIWRIKIWFIYSVMAEETAIAVFPYSSDNAEGLFFSKVVVNRSPNQWNITA